MSKSQFNRESICTTAIIDMDTEIDVTHVDTDKKFEKWRRNYEPSQELIDKFFPLRVCFYAFLVAVIAVLLAIFIHGIVTTERTHITFKHICSSGYCVEIDIQSIGKISDKIKDVLNLYKTQGFETLVIRASGLDFLEEDLKPIVPEIITYGKYVGLSVALSLDNLFVLAPQHYLMDKDNRYFCIKNGTAVKYHNKQIRLTNTRDSEIFIIGKLSEYTHLKFSFYFFEDFPLKFSPSNCSNFTLYDKNTTDYVIATIKENNTFAKFGGSNMDGTNTNESYGSDISVLKIKLFNSVPQNILNNTNVLPMVQNFVAQLESDLAIIGYMDHVSANPRSVAVAAFISPTYLYEATEVMNSPTEWDTYYDNITFLKDANTSITGLLLKILNLKEQIGFWKSRAQLLNSTLVITQRDESDVVRKIMLVDFDGLASTVQLGIIFSFKEKCLVLFATAGVTNENECNQINMQPYGIALLQIN